LALSAPTKGSDHPKLSLENLQEGYFCSTTGAVTEEMIKAYITIGASFLG
jgi:REP element-mobilizing transposase RayT